jgi:hypothetical protein
LIRKDFRTADVTESTEMSDLLYVAITIVVFALFFLLIKGVERIER